MKITKKQLTNLIKESIKLNESTDFSKKREVLLKARQNAMKFEKDIVSTLDLMDPDEMEPEEQKKYLTAMRKLEHMFVDAVAETMSNMAKMNLPKRKDNQDLETTPNSQVVLPQENTANATPQQQQTQPSVPQTK